MNITRYDPFITLLSQLRQSLDFPGARSFDDASLIEGSQWSPAIDIREEAKQFIIYADLPGVKKEDIKVRMENNMLLVEGERKEEKNVKSEESGYSRQERYMGKFSRQFSLPNTVDGENIEARLKEGVLEIVVPKKTAAQPRTIAIQEEK